MQLFAWCNERRRRLTSCGLIVALVGSGVTWADEPAAEPDDYETAPSSFLSGFDEVWSVAVSPDGSRVATSYSDGT